MCLSVQSQLTGGNPPSGQAREEGCCFPAWLQCPWMDERFGRANIVHSLSVSAGNTN